MKSEIKPERAPKAEKRTELCNEIHASLDGISIDLLGAPSTSDLDLLQSVLASLTELAASAEELSPRKAINIGRNIDSVCKRPEFVDLVRRFPNDFNAVSEVIGADRTTDLRIRLNPTGVLMNLELDGLGSSKPTKTTDLCNEIHASLDRISIDSLDAPSASDRDIFQSVMSGLAAHAVSAMRASRRKAIHLGRCIDGVCRRREFVELVQRFPHEFNVVSDAIGPERTADLNVSLDSTLTLEVQTAHTADGSGSVAPRSSSYAAAAERLLQSEAFHAPVVICGFHHSGTRLLARLLRDAGVFQRVNMATFEWDYIQALNTNALPGWATPSKVAAFDARASSPAISLEAIALRLASVGYDGSQPWGHKDPRNTVTADAWIAAFPNARIVHLMRDPLDTLGTLPDDRYARFSPEGQPPQQAAEFWAELWTAYVRRARQSMSLAAKAVEVRYEDLCREPAAVLAEIADALGLPVTALAPDWAATNLIHGRVESHLDWIADGRLSAAAAARLGELSAQQGYVRAQA